MLSDSDIVRGPAVGRLCYDFTIDVAHRFDL